MPDPFDIIERELGGKIVAAQGRDPFDVLQAELDKPTAAQDFAKQVGVGLVTGTEGLASFPAQAANLAAKAVGPYIEKAADYIWPGKGAQMQEAEKRRQEVMAAVQAQRGRGAADYFPDPQTTAGQFGRTIGETIPAFVGGTSGPLIGHATAGAVANLTGRQAPAALTRGAGISVPQAVAAGTTAGLASEAAGQATEGTAAEPYARVGANLVAGTAGLRAAEGAAARAAVPSIAALEQRGGQLYDQFRASGFNFARTASPQFAQTLRTELATRGLGDVAADRVWRVLDRFERQPFRTPQDFHAGYQELGQVARGAKEPAERLAANIAQERLLQFLERTPPAALTRGAPQQAVQTLREANADWAAAQRAKNVSQRITKAELKAGSNYSGLNLENELRRRIGVLAEPGGPSSGFTPRELEAFRRFAEGNIGSNTRRYVGNLLGKGGGLGATVAGGAGLGVGTLLTGGDPYLGAVAGGGAMLSGLGLGLLGNRMSLARARGLENMLRSRSPLAAQTMGPVVSPAAPFIGAIPAVNRTLGDLEGP